MYKPLLSNKNIANRLEQTVKNICEWFWEGQLKTYRVCRVALPGGKTYRFNAAAG